MVNGVPVSGATQATLTIASAALNDAGTYRVRVTNSEGTIESDSARLFVLPRQPPRILNQPLGATAAVGRTVRFSVTATNFLELSYQWRLDGEDLAGATQNTVAISDVQLADAGNYSVVIRTVLDAVESENAQLIVVPAPTGPGSVDVGFSPGSGSDGPVALIVAQVDGKLFIAGDFSAVNGVKRTRLARLNADGSLDPTFNPGAGPTHGPTDRITGTTVDRTGVSAILPLNDGRIYVGGMFGRFNGTIVAPLIRLDPDGSLDSTFRANALVGRFVYDAALQGENVVVILGDFVSLLSDPTQDPVVVRLLPDGRLDGSFSSPVTASEAALERWRTIRNLTVEDNGKIWMNGYFGFVNGVPMENWARLDPDGRLDESFAPTTRPSSGAFAIVQPDGMVVSSEFDLRRFQRDGSLDAGFQPIASAERIHAVLDGGKLIATTEDSVVRLYPDGSLDRTWTAARFSAGGDDEAEVSAVAIGPDGRVFIGGRFDRVNDVARNNIAALLAEGGKGERMRLSQVHLAENRFLVSFPTEPGRTYVLEYRPQIQAGNWTPLQSVTGDGTFQQLVDPSVDGATRFYRVRRND